MPPQVVRMIGEKLGNYRILRQIGAGGMGEVFLALNEPIQARVAVKALHADYWRRADVVQRFFSEARVTAELNHPGIVRVLDCGVSPVGQPYIVMELLEGETLALRLQRMGRLPLGNAVDVAMQAAAAMNAAHRRGLIHRDLKPENMVLVAHYDEDADLVRILDFGIAKLLQQDGKRDISRTNAILGTPLYMSPEQCRGGGEIDGRADIYSLGCVLYAMLTGRPPFVYEAVGDLLVAHMKETAPPVQSLRAEVPDDVAALVERCLAKAPGDRPATMADLRASLAAVSVPAPEPRSRLVPVAPAEDHVGVRTVTLQARSTAVMPVDMPAGVGATKVLPGAEPIEATGRTTLSGQAGERGLWRRPSSRWVTAGLGAVAVAVIGGTLLLRSPRAPAPAAPPRAPSAPGPAKAPPLPTAPPAAETPPPVAAAPEAPVPPAPVPEAEPATVRVGVANPPRGLQVWVDGKKARLPVVLTRDEHHHTFRFEAPGYEPETLQVRGTRNTTLRLQNAPEILHQ